MKQENREKLAAFLFKMAGIMEQKGDAERAQRFLDRAVEAESALT